MKEGDEKKRDFPDGPSISQKTDNSLLFEEDYMMISLQTIGHKSSTSVGTFSLEETHERGDIKEILLGALNASTLSTLLPSFYLNVFPNLVPPPAASGHEDECQDHP